MSVGTQALAEMRGETSIEKRPANCTMRLREEGKPAPKSGCASCDHGGMFGCPHDGTRIKDEPKPAFQSNPDAQIAYDLRKTVAELNKHLRLAAEAGINVRFSDRTIMRVNGTDQQEVDVSISKVL